MRIRALFFVLPVVGAFLLAGCGKVNTTDAGKSFSSGMTAAASGMQKAGAEMFSKNANFQKAVIQFAVQARQVARQYLVAKAGHYTICGSLSTPLHVNTDDGKYLVDASCSGSTVTVKVTTNADTSFSCTASSGTTAYSLKSGSSVTVAFTDGSADHSTGSLSFTLDCTFTGGDFASSGSKLTGGFTFDFSKISQLSSATNYSDVCAIFSPWTLKVDGSDVSCTDAIQNYAACT